MTDKQDDAVGQPGEVRSSAQLGLKPERDALAEQEYFVRPSSSAVLGLVSQLLQYAGENEDPAFRLQCLPRGVLLNAADTMEGLERSRATYFSERNSARDAWRERVKRCEEMEAALTLAVQAMRAPLDEWKGELERKALDAANAALGPN